MAHKADESRDLQIVALRNAEEILRARDRAMSELRETKEALQAKILELQREREQFQVTLASIGDAVITTDAHGRVAYLNAIAEHMTGLSLADALGQPLTSVFNIINEDTREPVVPPVEAVLREGRIVGLSNHTVLIARDGSTTAIEESAAPIRDSAGNISGAVMVFHDVTERRRAEEALRQSEARFRTIFNQAAVGIVLADLSSRFLQANQKLAEVLGYGPDELQQRTLLELIHPDDEPNARQCLDRLASEQVSDISLEARCLGKDGSTIWTLSTIKLVKDQAGHPQYLIGIIEDATERKRAEEAQSRLVAVIASSDDSIISMDLNGIIESWNTGAHRLYGYTEQEMIGRTSIVLIPPDRSDEESAILKQIRNGQRIEHFETIRRRKDGSLVDVSISVSPIEDRQGKILGASKITRDVTQRKRNEAALREMDRRKDEFLATLAHELRNPLAPIRQAALISRTEKSTEAQKRWSYEVISRQVHHMSLLLDDLLDISRITRGTLELRLQVNQINEVIEAATETVRPIVDAKRHSLSVVLPDEPVQLVADPLRLAQILGNLLNNASKYSDPGGRIEVRVRSTPEEVAISVKDSGIGIAREAIGGLFDMFSQIKSIQDRSEGGLGIGLALTKGLVELHGGRVEAKSAGLGQGSEFIVYLPLRDLPAAPAMAANRDGPGAITRRRLLIADDNRDAAQSLAMLLELEGHEVRVVHDGRAALKVFEEFQPEVALLDIGMPELTGYEVARSVRNGTLGRAVTLIALTGWGQDRDKDRALAAGFNHHFTKPVEPDRITEILSALPRR